MAGILLSQVPMESSTFSLSFPSGNPVPYSLACGKICTNHCSFCQGHATLRVDKPLSFRNHAS